MSRISSKFSSLSVILCLLLLLSSCGSDDGYVVVPIPSGTLIIFNALVDSPQVRFITNNQVTGTLQFGQSTPATRVLPQIALDLTADYVNNNTRTVLLEDQVLVEVDFREALILAGTLAAPRQIRVQEGPFAYPEGSTFSRIRFINATNALDNLTLTLTHPNGDVLNLNLGLDEVTDRLSVEAGVGLTARITDAGGNELWTSGTFDLTAGVDRRFVIVDYFGPGSSRVRMSSINEPTGVLLFTNQTLGASIRFAHTAANEGPLEFYVDDVLLDTLNFGEIGDYATITAGARTFRVNPVGDATTLLTEIERTISLGRFHTFAIARTTEDYGSALAVEDRRPVSVRSVLSITNLQSTNAALDLYLVAPGTGIGGFTTVGNLIQFNSAAFDFAFGSFDLEIAAGGTKTSLFGPSRIDLESARFYSVFVADEAGGGGTQVILVDDVTP